MQILGDKKIWAIGGGKGGVGKTIMTSNLGLSLAGHGKQVVLLDADLGCANLHTMLGIKNATRTLNDFLSKKYTLEEILLDTGTENLKIISGANAILGLANPNFLQKQRLINHLKTLPADYILLDLGAGTSYNMLDFFTIANEGLVVICPEPTSIQNGYGFIKSAFYRRLNLLFSKNMIITPLLQEMIRPKSKRYLKTMTDLIELVNLKDPKSAQALQTELSAFKTRIIANMVNSDEDKESVLAVKMVAEKFLGIQLDLVGNIYSHSVVAASVKKMQPFMQTAPQSQAALEVNQIVEYLMEAQNAAATPV
ncbi:MAG: AAA family ATPase [Candidatus Schekmanbacteria bacterium]|nr:AAA family ATPase [Candidatus Schekmanbacteria bacterium]